MHACQELLVTVLIFFHCRLKEIETYEVCMHVRNYLEQFLIIPSHASFSDVHDYDTVMKDICSYVRGYVKAILEQEEDYHKMVAARDPLALQEFFQHYLSKYIRATTCDSQQ